MRSIILPLIATTAVLLPTGSLAAKDASGSTNIRLVVPEVCTVNAELFTLSEGGEAVGTVQEYCNASTGFQIAVSHRPLEFNERAVVQYGGNATSLDDTGFYVAANRSGQRLARIAVKVDAQNLAQPLAIAFSVIPI